MRSFGLFIALIAVSTGCVADHDDVAEAQGLLTEGSADAVGVLALVNAPTTTFEVLDIDARLDRRAARGLVDGRPFDSVAQVDAVRWVGASALNKLVAYSRANGFVPSGSDVVGVFDGVSFTFDQASAALSLVNSATATTLREQVRLDSRAVNSIVDARPVATVEQLSELYYVGKAMLTRIRDYAAPIQLGIISDLDKTVIPPHGDELPEAPYAGVATLYNAIDRGAPSDVYYVTARSEDRVQEIPDWLVAKGIPNGLIHTGISPIPYIARDEKVRDILSVFDANPDQRFVMFGDTNHVDADAFREVIAQRPEQVVAAFVHNVKAIDASRVAGLHLFEDHREVADTLVDLDVIDTATAAAVKADVESAPAELR